MLVRQKLITEPNGQIAIHQHPYNGFDISYNPDDSRFYVCDRNEYGDLETRATFAGTQKGFYNARQYAKTHTANNPQ